MSAHLSPEELKKIAPEEYAKQYGEDETERARLSEIRAETRRLNTETRLLNARRRYQKATEPKQPTKPRRGTKVETRGAIYFVIALLYAIAQFAIGIYIFTHY